MLLRLFGGFELLSPAGQPVHPATRKTALLLAALGVAGDKGLRRDMLCSMFWPDRADAQARGSLRQSLAAIRTMLAESGDPSVRLDADQDSVCLAAEAAGVDVRLFDRLTRAAMPEDLAGAAELYRGDLLAGIALEGPADPWFETHRRAFRNTAQTLCEDLSWLAEGGLERAAGPCESLAGTLLAADQTAEEAHRALIRLHLSRGRTNAALRQFELCREILQRELSLEPEAATIELGAAARSPRSAPRHDSVEAALPPSPLDLARGASDQPSIVVMPFDNLSGADDDYFVDGVVEEITAALSRIRNFFVIARQSAFTYKGRAVDVREVGLELGVAYVVEGTVRRGGERLRISVQLVDAKSRTQLWFERYDGVTTDVFDFQDQIASQVAAALHPAIRKAEIDLARRRPPNSLRAYDLVMRAWPNLWGQNAEANELAMSSLGEALEIDPAYARAQALLAWCHAIKAIYVWCPEPQHELDVARRLVEMTRDAIDDDPTALTAAGATLSLSGDLERGGALIGEALSLDPNNAWAWTRFGWVAVYRGDAGAARERFERAMALSPLDPFAFNMRLGIAQALAMSGSLGPAIAIAKEVIHRHPEVTWAWRPLAAWSALDGDLDAARQAAVKLLEAQPDFTLERYGALPLFQHFAGWRDETFRGLRLAGLPER